MRDRQRLEEKFRHHLHGERYGDIVSFFKGTGIEVDDSRQWQPGDHSKHINRKLTAKHDKLYVNTYQAELAPHVDIFLDVNQNRTTGEEQPLREQVAGLLADYALVTERWHTNTTIWWFDGDWQRASLRAYPTWLHRLPELEKIVTNTVASQRGYTTHLPRFVDMLLAEKKPQRIVLLLSDFLITPKELQESLELLRGHHVPATIQLPVSTITGQHFDLFSYKSPPEEEFTPTIVV